MVKKGSAEDIMREIKRKTLWGLPKPSGLTSAQISMPFADEVVRAGVWVNSNGAAR